MNIIIIQKSKCKNLSKTFYVRHKRFVIIVIRESSERTHTVHTSMDKHEQKRTRKKKHSLAAVGEVANVNSPKILHSTQSTENSVLCTSFTQHQ